MCVISGGRRLLDVMMSNFVYQFSVITVNSKRINRARCVAHREKYWRKTFKMGDSMQPALHVHVPLWAPE
jgi:hypothetical protein